MSILTVGTDFSGIGAPEQALKNMGVPHTVAFACDKDKYARQTYQANHDAGIMYEDIVARDHASVPYVDLYCFGFPCQAFSISGKRKGFDDIRGTLFFNSAEYIRTHRPRVFIAENVKGILSHDRPKGSKAKHGRTFSTIINLLAKTVNGQQQMQFYEDNLGYNVYYTVLNSKHYDVPQNRERVFIVGFRDDVDFSFPNSKTVSKRLKDVLEPVVDEKYFLSEKMISYFKTRSSNFNNGNINLKTEDDIASTINANTGASGLDISDNIIIDGSVTPHSQSAMCYNANGIFTTVIAGTHGYAMGYIIPEPTKKGYSIANDGDSVDIKNANSTTRRGRVGKQIANTLDTDCKQAVVVPDNTTLSQTDRLFTPDDLFPTITSPAGGGYKNGNIVVDAEMIQLNDIDESGGKQPYQQNRVYDTEGIAPASLAQLPGGGHKILNGKRIRRLTPLECMRLQGYPDALIKPCSDTQIYKQAGNSITVYVLEAIFIKILKALKLWDGMHIQA